MKTLIIAILALITIGCTSSYRAAYDRGEITAAQMYQLELQNRQAMSQAFSQAGQYFQNQDAINRMNQPVIVWGLK